MRTRLPGPRTAILCLTGLTLWPVDHAVAAPSARAGQVASQEPGIPVTSQEVIDGCGSCHQIDETGRMGRISYMRKTPEGWQRSLLRMVSLQGVQVDPEVARSIVRYLSNEHGLAPEELRPAHWEVERRIVPNEAPNEIIRETCTACHSVGRILTQRRTAEEWRLLTETHRAYYPLIDNQVYRSSGGTPDDPYPVEEALEYLAEALPLASPDWTEWSASSRPPRLEGSWALTGWEVGRGPLYGTLEVQSTGDGAEFATRATYTYAADGATVTREGEVLVYTGFQWRGRSQSVGDSDTARMGANGELREVMFVEPEWREVHGRWYTGAYDELGLDVSLDRVGSDPLLSGTYPEALRTGGQVDLAVYGANLPSELRAVDLDLGPGVQVSSVVETSPTRFIVRVSVEPGAPTGPRSLHLGHVTLTDAVTVYDRVARIEVGPSMGMARVGGASLPKQYERFEAIGYAAGADGEPGTDDDLRLGMMDVEWSLEEYPVSIDDDDIRFVGSLDGDGFFTPAQDGPNPERSGDRNNIGDVWVTATYRPSDGGPALEARGQLVVTVPLYLRWELAPPAEDLEADR